MTASRQARDRWGVAARAVAAVGGGYLSTAAATTLLALLLPVARADAAIIGTMLSFLLYACAVLWVFAVRSAWRAWFGMMAFTAAPAALLWLHRSLP